MNVQNEDEDVEMFGANNCRKMAGLAYENLVCSGRYLCQACLSSPPCDPQNRHGSINISSIIISIIIYCIYYYY